MPWKVGGMTVLTEYVTDLHGGLGPSNARGVYLHCRHVAHIVEDETEIRGFSDLDAKKRTRSVIVGGWSNLWMDRCHGRIEGVE